MSKKELVWVIVCGSVWTTCFLVMGVLELCKLTSIPYWYENLISLCATPCLVYCLLTLGRFIGRRESKLPIEKLIDEELKK